MAVTLVNLTGFQRGIESEETSINCSLFEITVEPEFKEKLMGITGESRGFAVGQFRRILRIEGEISGTGGIMGITSASSGYTAANDSSYWGVSAGAFYFDRGVVTQTRDGYKSVSAELSSDPNIP